MRKFTLILLTFFLIPGPAFPQGCLVEGAFFTTQNQIDSFQVNYPGCTEILGGMTISGSDITNLQGLEVLTTLWNELVIEDNPALTSLAGLDNVNHAWAYVTIENNDALTSLEGLDGLERIESSLTIGFNAALASLAGLENLSSTSGGVYIYFNDNLASLEGLQGLASIAGGLYIESNPLLTSLDGLDSIAGSSISNLTIRDNAALSECDARSICDYLAAPNGTVEIYDNANGCDNQVEVEEDCANNCLPNGIIFTTQAQIDSFQVNYPGCSEIEGNIEIAGNEITNLNGLSQVTTVIGNLLIGHSFGGGNPELLTLGGLEGLTSIGGGLWIGNNDRLKDLNGLNSLSSIDGGLQIGGFSWGGAPAGNDSLETLVGLNNLVHLGGSLDIICNPLLINLEGLDGLTAVGGSILLYCSNLTSLSGLEQVTKIGFDLELFENNLLIDLSGLENLDTIGGSLLIGPCGLGGPSGPPGENGSLTSLNGLQNLSAIGGNLHIGGHAINSLAALSNLKSVGYLGGSYNGWIYVCETDSLTSLSGLDNIEAGTIDHLEITSNSSLSECDVESVCDYLKSPNGTIGIYFNAPGCNSQDEVEEACEAISVGEQSAENRFSIYPNPSSGFFTLTFFLADPAQVRLEVLNQVGQTVEIFNEGYLLQGEHQIHYNAEGLPPGVYFCKLSSGNAFSVRKLALIR